jgi:hypothetical protein|tara:strand:+ start:1910 stop:2047 length:138 start_codon:yes stop_codon:yes gene_type:complete
MNIDIAYLIILILTNIGTYHYAKFVGIQKTIDYLEAHKMIELDDD